MAAPAIVLCCALTFAQTTTIADRVRLAVTSGNLGLARAELAQSRKSGGINSSYIEALSWLGRGELAARNYTAAEANATEVRGLCLAQLSHQKLDGDSSLPAALGASIEVEALAAALQGRRDQAVVFLRGEAQRWGGTSIQNRIQKNLNLLTLEGRPAPPLDLTQAVTNQKLLPIASLRGHPLLLFFWAHWCVDCKREVGIVEDIQRRFSRAGLIVVAPTQHYGYTAAAANVSASVETGYIREIWKRDFAVLGPVATPLSERNFAAYGVSTTPTLVLIDREGIVRMYNPGALSEQDLSSRVRALADFR